MLQIKICYNSWVQACSFWSKKTEAAFILLCSHALLVWWKWTLPASTKSILFDKISTKSMDQLVQTKHCSIAINSRGQHSRVICQKLSVSVEDLDGFGDWLVQETFRKLSFLLGHHQGCCPSKKMKIGGQQNGSVKQRDEKADWWTKGLQHL